MALPQFSYIPSIKPTVAGGATDEEYSVRRNYSSQDQFYGYTNFSIPIEQLSANPIEGTDYPFLLRFETAKAPIDRNWAWLQQFKNQVVFLSTYGLGMPEAVFGAPPDETPIIVGKMLDVPFTNWARLKKDQWAIAAIADEAAAGSWVEIIPATDYTITVCNLLSEIQEHLLETVDGGQTFGSGLWTVDEVVAYLNQRLSRFLVETGVVQFRTTQAAPSADQVYNLPTDLIDLRRAAWTSQTSPPTTTELPRIDSLQADLWQTWETPQAQPLSHMLVPEKSLEIRLAPQPSSDGTLDFIYVRDFSPVINNCAVLPLPDEWVWCVKWGVIADMLSKEGEANDPERAAYAEKRYQEGVTLSRLFMGTNQ